MTMRRNAQQHWDTQWQSTRAGIPTFVYTSFTRGPRSALNRFKASALIACCLRCQPSTAPALSLLSSDNVLSSINVSSHAAFRQVQHAWMTAIVLH